LVAADIDAKTLAKSNTSILKASDKSD
jgi:hypothetical protein